MSELAANVAMAAAVLAAGVALALFVIALLSWRRIGGSRLAWVAAAFLVLTAQAAYVGVQAYRERGAIAEAGLASFPATVAVLDLLLVAALYLSVWKQ